MRIVGYISASLIAIIAALLFALFNRYVFFEIKTNHTGAPIESAGPVCALMALAALPGAVRTRNLGRRLLAAALALSALAAANIVLFDRLHIMSPCGTWVRGQPERPECSILSAKLESNTQ
jgi:hypothetical protein